MALEKDIKRIKAIVQSVNELVRMNLLAELTNEPKVYVEPNILKLKDVKYLGNWSYNLLLVWRLTFKIEADELDVYDKDSGVLLFRYSKVNGIVYS